MRLVPCAHGHHETHEFPATTYSSAPLPPPAAAAVLAEPPRRSPAASTSTASRRRLVRHAPAPPPQIIAGLQVRVLPRQRPRLLDRTPVSERSTMNACSRDSPPPPIAQWPPRPLTSATGTLKPTRSIHQPRHVPRTRSCPSACRSARVRPCAPSPASRSRSWPTSCSAPFASSPVSSLSQMATAASSRAATQFASATATAPRQRLVQPVGHGLLDGVARRTAPRSVQLGMRHP